MKVEKFEQADESRYPAWWTLKIEGEARPYLVHSNRIGEIGQLKPGDEVQFDKTKAIVYVGVTDYQFLENLRKVEGKK